MAETFATIEDMIAAIGQLGGHSVKAINDGMHDLMKQVQDDAIANAPVDEGALERSIKLENGGQRRSWAVYVDEDEPDDTGKYTVGDYALKMHEGIYNLGPKSEEKQAANGHVVGRKFLERAFEDAQADDAIGKLNRTLNEALDARYGR